MSEIDFSNSMMGEIDFQKARNMEIDIAALGQEAQVFLTSSLGKYLMERADMMQEEAIAQLVVASPSDTQANTDLRNTIRVADMFKSWLQEAVRSGELAIHNLRESDAAEMN